MAEKENKIFYHPEMFVEMMVKPSSCPVHGMVRWVKHKGSPVFVCPYDHEIGGTQSEGWSLSYQDIPPGGRGSMRQK